MKNDVYIGFHTAMAAWHAIRLKLAFGGPETWIGSDIAEPYGAVRSRRLGGSAAGIADKREAICRELGIPDSKVHILVACDEDRAQSRGIASHVVRPGNLPAGSFCNVAPGLNVSSPELTFLQMASKLDFDALLELGYMMCGTFTLSFGQGGKSVGVPPVSSVDRLSRFLDKVESVWGLHDAKRAVRFIRDRSNSPRETHTVLLLCLPPRLHGMSCPFPLLNDCIVINGATIYPDYHWPEEGVVGEYFGSQHGSLQQMLRDAQRANTQTSGNLRAFTVTNDHLSDTDALIDLGNLVRKLLGKRCRSWTPDEYAGLDDLRRRLTDPFRTQRWENLYLRGSWY